MPWWDNLNEYVPDNPYYDNGVITVGDVTVDFNSDTDDGYDPYWDDLSQFVPQDGNLYDLDDYRDTDGLPWGWLAAGGAVLVLLYAMRR